ncbi:MAG: hypothetical protein KAI66_13775, partial [Lentisphaeria bacterium]|nr:hypothetical protein [Lentisphaeria bacterium]
MTRFVTLLILFSTCGVRAADSAGIRHRFVCIDNKRNKLHYIDQFEPGKSWSRDIPAGSRDLQVLPGRRLLVSHGDGAAQYDLPTGRPLAWRVGGLKGINTARKLRNGQFLLGANTAKGIEFHLYGTASRPRGSWVEKGTENIRLVRELRNGNLVHVSSKPRRIVEATRKGEIVRSILLKDKGYSVLELPSGNLLGGTGNGCEVIERTWKGEIVFRVGGKDKHPNLGLDFFSGFDLLPNGNIVSTNWLGHGKHGTGPHLVEFDRQNRLVWKWEDHKLAAQITNVLMLDHLQFLAHTPESPPASTQAVVDIVPADSKWLVSAKVRRRALIHTNRAYAFSQIPDFLQNLQYTRTEHRTPGTYACTVKEPGTIYLALGESATLRENEGTPAWHFAGRMLGKDGGANRDWTIYRAKVSRGETFTIKPKNKWGSTLFACKVGAPKAPPRGADSAREYAYLKRLLKNRPDKKRLALLAEQAHNRQALIWEQDRDPLDIVLRRTRALANDLRRMPDSPDLTAESADLAALEQEVKNTSVSDERARLMLFNKTTGIRRRIAFKNPLLNFTRIAFLTHFRARRSHMCDQYFGFYAQPGGSLFVLDDALGEEPEARDLLADAVVENGPMKGKRLEDGAFISLELTYDAKQFYFAWTAAHPDLNKWTPESCYHLFRINTDGTGLVQLTEGSWNDFDPCELPDGRIAFISERRGGYGRCHGRPVPTYTLHAMNPDGTGIHTLSYHETNEWHPSVNNNGMIAFSRWDYVDRDSDIAHHIWLCFPDGRDPRSFHGNYPVKRHSRPWMELSIRAIPESHKYIAVAAPHHGQSYGSLVLIDQRLDDDDSMSQLKRITPENPFPEAEQRGLWMYANPWPFSDDYYLCAFDWGGHRHGIYLVDAFGNHELIYGGSEVPVIDPIPLRPRRKPPIIARMTTKPTYPSTKPMGTVAIMNVYESDFEWPKGTKITALRIVQLFPKASPSANLPNIGAGAQSLARGVLGTVPVEPDGSAYFEMPANVPVYFQALDSRGLMVQNMRSDAFVHEGERLTCLGCHEPKRKAAPVTRNAMPAAIARTPSTITPEVSGSYPLTFPRLVQPVLDRHCVSCHAKSKKAPKLDAKIGGGDWTRAFNNLRKYAWARHGGNGAIRRNEGSRSLAGRCGANGSRLFKLLEKGHHGVKLPPEDLRRITLWLDCNSNFFGAYHKTAEQAKGERILPDLQ